MPGEKYRRLVRCWWEERKTKKKQTKSRSSSSRQRSPGGDIAPGSRERLHVAARRRCISRISDKLGKHDQRARARGLGVIMSGGGGGRDRFLRCSSRSPGCACTRGRQLGMILFPTRNSEKAALFGARNRLRRHRASSRGPQVKKKKTKKKNTTTTGDALQKIQKKKEKKNNHKKIAGLPWAPHSAIEKQNKKHGGVALLSSRNVNYTYSLRLMVPFSLGYLSSCSLYIYMYIYIYFGGRF